MSVGGESGVGGASARNVGAPELSNVIGESWMRVFPCPALVISVRDDAWAASLGLPFGLLGSLGIAVKTH